MKNVLSLFCISIFLYTSCSSDDDDRSFQDNSLNGQWYLENISCFCVFPDNPKFYENELTFDTSTSEVNVKKGSIISFIDAGNFSYEMPTDTTLTINKAQYSYEINKAGKLVLFSNPSPNIADDARTAIYVRGKGL
jgi:hypothetical protein